jgi:hypothetical protein
MTTPMPTFVDGDLVRQGPLNLLPTGITNLSLLLNGVPPTRSYIPAVSVSLNTPQLVPNNTDKTLSWNTSGVNNDAMWVNTDPTKITVKTGGVYVAVAQVHFTANATGMRACHIMLNGTSIIANSVAVTAVNNLNAGAGNAFTAMTNPMRLAPGATIYLSVFQNSGGNLNADIGESGTFLAVYRWGN